MSLSAADGTMAVPGLKTERAALSTEPQTWYGWRFCSEDLASPRLFKSRRLPIDERPVCEDVASSLQEESC